MAPVVVVVLSVPGVTIMLSYLFDQFRYNKGEDVIELIVR